MQSDDVSKWLKRFYSHPDTECIDGDDLGTTIGMCGAVILAAVLSGTISPEDLSEVTGLPAAFCAVVIANLDYNRMWTSEKFLGLCKSLRDGLDNAGEIRNWLDLLLEDYWVWSAMPGLCEMLPALRGRCLLFGRHQSWIDHDRLEELLGDPMRISAMNSIASQSPADNGVMHSAQNDQSGIQVS